MWNYHVIYGNFTKPWCSLVAAGTLLNAARLNSWRHVYREGLYGKLNIEFQKLASEQWHPGLHARREHFWPCAQNTGTVAVYGDAIGWLNGSTAVWEEFTRFLKYTFLGRLRRIWWFSLSSPPWKLEQTSDVPSSERKYFNLSELLLCLLLLDLRHDLGKLFLVVTARVSPISWLASVLCNMLNLS